MKSEQFAIAPIKTFAVTGASNSSPTYNEPSASEVLGILGSIIGLLVFAGSVGGILWKIAEQKNRVDNNASAIAALQKEKESDADHEAKFKEELMRATKAEIASSASDVCHGFELFAVEVRGSIASLKEKLNDLGDKLCQKDETVNHMRNDLEKIKESGRETAKYLDSLRPYLPGVDRRDGGNVSGTGSYRQK